MSEFECYRNKKKSRLYTSETSDRFFPHKNIQINIFFWTIHCFPNYKVRFPGTFEFECSSRCTGRCCNSGRILFFFSTNRFRSVCLRSHVSACALTLGRQHAIYRWARRSTVILYRSTFLYSTALNL